jgi:hypothetical protein
MVGRSLPGAFLCVWVRDRHEISISNVTDIGTNCIVPYTLTFLPPRSGTGLPVLPTLGLAGSFLIGVSLMDLSLKTVRP